jgi:hypothetical protein
MQTQLVHIWRQVHLLSDLHRWPKEEQGFKLRMVLTAKRLASARELKSSGTHRNGRRIETDGAKAS